MIYACSDIHGQYDKFLKMLEIVNFQKSDELYILGDVIDRGAKPIDLLLYILGESNMHLLMGNHEHMMLRAIKHNDIHRWLRNGCSTSIRQLKQMSEDSVERVMRVIEELPLIIPDLEVNGKKFYLTHAGMANRVLEKPLFLFDVTEQEIDDILWDRKLAMGIQPRDIISSNVYERYGKHIILFGHTMSCRCMFGKCAQDGLPRISSNYDGTVVNIDCGCSQGKALGFLRLDDMSEFYV